MNSNTRPINRSAPRDSKGRPNYLRKLPLWKRYPKTIIVGGGALVGTIPWIYQLYQALFFGPEDVPPGADLWPSERVTGKRIVDQYKERQEKIKYYEELYKKQREEAEQAVAQLKKVK